MDALYAPPMLARPGEVTITPWSYQSVGAMLFASDQGGPAGQNYVAANVVVFVPFWVPEPTVITKLFWANGNAVAGNLDVGVYDEGQNLLVSAGSTAQATISVLQVIDVTDTVVARGRYYLAIVSDTSDATQKLHAVLPAAGIPQSFGLLEQASVTLPLSTGASPATFAKYTRAYVPLFGLQAYRAIGP